MLDFGYAEIASALQRSEGACRLVLVNGELGLLRFFSGSLHSVLAFETAGDRIVSISIVANPVKMSAAALTSGHAAGP